MPNCKNLSFDKAFPQPRASTYRSSRSPVGGWNSINGRASFSCRIDGRRPAEHPAHRNQSMIETDDTIGTATVGCRTLAPDAVHRRQSRPIDIPTEPKSASVRLISCVQLVSGTCRKPFMFIEKESAVAARRGSFQRLTSARSGRNDRQPNAMLGYRPGLGKCRDHEAAKRCFVWRAARNVERPKRASGQARCQVHRRIPLQVKGCHAGRLKCGEIASENEHDFRRRDL